MKRKGMYAICAAMFLAVSARAVPSLPDILPPISFDVSPENPTTADEVRLIFTNASWPTSCPPQTVDISVVGNTIFVDLLMPDATGPGCTPLDCEERTTAWQINASAGMLPPGQYEVFLRGVGCDNGDAVTTPFERVGSFEVGLPAGGGVIGVGDCVVLLRDNPPSAPTLVAGRMGRVICFDGFGNLLISWAFFAGGMSEATGCQNGDPVIFPPKSAVWVNPRETLLGLCFDECGVLSRTPQGCVVLEAEDGSVYNLMDAADIISAVGAPGGIEFNATVRVRGLINTTPPGNRVCPQLSGDIYQAVITFCVPAGGDKTCCDGRFRPGDRVVLTAEKCAAGLHPGATGIVVCCDFDDPEAPILVSWGGFTKGTSATGDCDTMVVPFPMDSGVWMCCDQIARPHELAAGTSSTAAPSPQQATE